MVFTTAGGGATTATVDVPAADRNRFSITDEDVVELARFAVEIERHYGRPMDIEWGKDGLDGKLYILQARPETVKSQAGPEGQEHYKLRSRSRVLASGRAIGQKIGLGPVRIVADASEMSRVQAGDVLVTDMTDPNWEPVMKRAAAIVTNRGGRTCHAAIIARELGIPAVVGCGDATRKLADGALVTVSCAEGDTGNVYDGRLEVEVTTQRVGEMPRIPVKISMNVGNPQLAFDLQRLPNAGVGLARLEFVINNMIGVHPKAVLEYPDLDDEPPPRRRVGRARLSGPAVVLRREARRGRRDDRRRLLAQAGDRPALRLQVERVPQADRRRRATSRRKRIRCSASAAPRAMWPNRSGTASRWSARR